MRDIKDITRIVTQIIIDKLGVEPEQVTPDATFADDLHSDPLDTEEVIEALEEEFDLSIPEEQMEKLKTVGQVIAYIEQHTKA